MTFQGRKLINLLACPFLFHGQLLRNQHSEPQGPNGCAGTAGALLPMWLSGRCLGRTHEPCTLLPSCLLLPSAQAAPPPGPSASGCLHVVWTHYCYVREQAEDLVKILSNAILA